MSSGGILAIDIGGTKIAAGIFSPERQLVAEITYPSGRGIPQLTQALYQCIQWAAAYSIDAMAVASPGKLLGHPHHSVTIAPKSAQNLESFPGEFDHLCIHDIFKSQLQISFPIFVINDALAQLCGGVSQLNIQGPITTGYIGPGTGLGGGFAELSSNNSLCFKTDGHIFDIMLKRDPNDQWSPPGEWVMSEDVISGRGFHDMAGISVAHYFQFTDQYPHITPIWEMIERYATQLFTTLKSGRFTKKDAHTNWSTHDQIIPSQSTLWLLGGSVGPRLFPSLKNTIGTRFPSNQIAVIPSPKIAALTGVVYARDMT